MAKTSRVRTNYKLRVGEQEQGRYTPYSQVRTPPNGKYPNEEAEKYYRHPKGAKITKASHFDYEYVLGHKIVFICVARGKPRPKIVWFKDGRELYDHNYLHVRQVWKIIEKCWPRGRICSLPLFSIVHHLLNTRGPFYQADDSLHILSSFILAISLSEQCHHFLLMYASFLV